ncbi:MAG: class I SAM-dependent methyltransferase [Betaproteobacteria bacterium]|nr:class I SAM-dependent methyltransferase [Betaproteobacteria bacterium]
MNRSATEHFGGTGNPAKLWDYVDLALLRAAKRNRARLSGPEGTQKFYGSFFTREDIALLHSRKDRRREARAETLRSAVRELLAGGGRLLDVGCGVGDNLAELGGLGIVLRGLEYAEQSARVARTALGDSAEVMVGSATAIPLSDTTTDVVVCLEVLEHIHDHEGALREIGRVLKPHGHLVISVPYRHWFPVYEPLMGHLRHYTRDDLEGLLARHGYRIVRYLPNYPGWSRWADYVYVLCRALERVAARFGWVRSAAEITLPGLSRPLAEILLDRLDWLKRREADLPYPMLGTSTFVVAERSG